VEEKPKVTPEEGARKAANEAATAAHILGDDQTADMLRLFARSDPKIVKEVVADLYFGEEIKRRWRIDLEAILDKEIERWRSRAKWIGGIAAVLGISSITWLTAELTSLGKTKEELGRVKEELISRAGNLKQDVKAQMDEYQNSARERQKDNRSEYVDLKKEMEDAYRHEVAESDKTMAAMAAAIGQMNDFVKAEKSFQDEVNTKQDNLKTATDGAVKKVADASDKLVKLDDLALDARKARLFEFVFLRHNLPEKTDIDVPEPEGRTHEIHVITTFLKVYSRIAADIDIEVIQDGVKHTLPTKKFNLHDELYIDNSKTVSVRLEAIRNEILAHPFIIVSLRMPSKDEATRAEQTAGVTPR